MTATERKIGTTLGDRIVALMADGQERTLNQIAAVLGGPKKSVAHAARALTHKGAAQALYVVRSDERRGHIYAAGAAENARDRETSPSAALERTWPKADPVTQRAIHAMVSLGRPARAACKNHTV